MENENNKSLTKLDSNRSNMERYYSKLDELDNRIRVIEQTISVLKDRSDRAFTLSNTLTGAAVAIITLLIDRFLLK